VNKTRNRQKDHMRQGKRGGRGNQKSKRIVRHTALEVWDSRIEKKVFEGRFESRRKSEKTAAPLRDGDYLEGVVEKVRAVKLWTHSPQRRVSL